MKCKKDANSARCTCTYPGCPRHGLCCDCMIYHQAKRQLPGCYFPSEVESTWERSYEAFAKLVQQGQI